jgi:hypothetical protein
MNQDVAVAFFITIVMGSIIVLPIILKMCGIGAKRVAMKNSRSGQITSGFYGFSWTYFFFGWWVPLLRGEFGIAALHFLFSIFTFGIWQVIVSFMFNRQCTGRLLEAGYIFVDKPILNEAAAYAIGVDLNVQRSAMTAAF